jgi:hypothetical protein
MKIRRLKPEEIFEEDNKKKWEEKSYSEVKCIKCGKKFFNRNLDKQGYCSECHEKYYLK